MSAFSKKGRHTVPETVDPNTALDALDPVPDTQRDGTAPAKAARAAHDAFVLAGGVAKGAFTAGALAVLTDPRAGLALSPRRIVGASSGSLNAAYLAYRVRSGDVGSSGTELAEIWLDDATYRAFDVSLEGVVTLSGLSTTRKLRDVLARHIRPSTGRHPIDLRLLATNMAGEFASVDGHPATTFEHVFRYDGAAFDSQEQLEPMFTAVCASAAFPGAFVPVEAEIRGIAAPCLDGGIVNNAPLKHAIGEFRDVARVFVITPTPRVQSAIPKLRGLSLLSHLVDVLIQERLFRDLREAESINEALRRLDVAFPKRQERDIALGALGWRERRLIEVVEIRPPSPLAGGAFDALFSRPLREEYIEAGKVAARAAIDAIASKPVADGLIPP